MAMPAFEDVILKKQWVPTHMVRIMLVCMPVTAKVCSEQRKYKMYQC